MTRQEYSSPGNLTPSERSLDEASRGIETIIRDYLDTDVKFGSLAYTSKGLAERNTALSIILSELIQDTGRVVEDVVRTLAFEFGESALPYMQGPGFITLRGMQERLGSLKLIGDFVEFNAYWRSRDVSRACSDAEQFETDSENNDNDSEGQAGAD